jgi:hypothetical protein
LVPTECGSFKRWKVISKNNPLDVTTMLWSPHPGFNNVMVLWFFRAFIPRVEGTFHTKIDLATALLHVAVLFPDGCPFSRKVF